ncbi:L-lysine 2-3-aminomutase [Penicillium bovifimosum]|uniref:L-lysine 2-3-aminomutase n=1 Tax=Penicillium bovifimosum TaxID=126998 RepID=A0A9W9L6A8_9EURO|nr:L-lysine 2-3-aminomutase [Penicillium bovifimosum]KAJ5139186.1 L-lysine 2-3-aminomutase [Penicillium bovifimosum]
MTDDSGHSLCWNQKTLKDIIVLARRSSTYDHRVWKTGLPVRSAVLKPHAGELVVGWVTTSESSLFSV